jgi:hypothetical protein
MRDCTDFLLSLQTFSAEELRRQKWHCLSRPQLISPGVVFYLLSGSASAYKRFVFVLLDSVLPDRQKDCGCWNAFLMNFCTKCECVSSFVKAVVAFSDYSQIKQEPVIRRRSMDRKMKRLPFRGNGTGVGSECEQN